METRIQKYSLLIVGNGFDLNCSYNTKYSHFCDYLIQNQPIKNKLLLYFHRAYEYGYMDNDNWTSFEKILCHYLEFLNYLFTNPSIEYKYDVIDCGFNSNYYPRLIIKNFDSLPINFQIALDIGNPLADISRIYWFDSDNKKHAFEIRIDSIQNFKSELHININRAFDVVPSKEDVKTFIINYLNNLLCDAEKTLAAYIKNETTRELPLSNFIYDNIGNETECVVSFNYSHVVERLFCLTSNKIAYVHGDVDNEIILGIEENMISNQSIKELSSYNVFFKRPRRFVKKCNDNFANKIINKIKTNTKLAIFGHSLDLSDKSLFRNIFSYDFAQCDIYYYGEEADYRMKFVELVGINVAERLSDLGKIRFIKIT